MATYNFGSVYTSLFAHKTDFFWCFDASLKHMATRSRGYGTNFGWLRKSCDISTCDLSPDRNPEKYGRAMKSAIIVTFSLEYPKGPCLIGILDQW